MHPETEPTAELQPSRGTIVRLLRRSLVYLRPYWKEYLVVILLSR